jgi:hypothetical protein
MSDKKISRPQSAQHENPNFPVFHIDGPPGAGKTTMGQSILTNFGSQVHVEDFDNLRNRFLDYCASKGVSAPILVKNFGKFYQIFLNSFIKAHSNLPLVLTGIARFVNKEGVNYKGTWIEPKFILNVPGYKFFIDIPVDVILRQRFYRDFNNAVERDYQYAMRNRDHLYQLYKDGKNGEALKDATRGMNFAFNHKLHLHDIDVWRKSYLNDGYIPADRGKIGKFVVKTITESLKHNNTGTDIDFKSKLKHSK